MNWKLIFIPVAFPIEIASAVLTGRETSFGNWVFDRRLGDPVGKTWQTREEAISDQQRQISPIGDKSTT